MACSEVSALHESQRAEVQLRAWVLREHQRPPWKLEKFCVYSDTALTLDMGVRVIISLLMEGGYSTAAPVWFHLVNTRPGQVVDLGGACRNGRCRSKM